jgi:hypothetical protein
VTVAMVERLQRYAATRAKGAAPSVAGRSDRFAFAVVRTAITTMLEGGLGWNPKRRSLECHFIEAIRDVASRHRADAAAKASAGASAHLSTRPRRGERAAESALIALLDDEFLHQAALEVMENGSSSPAQQDAAKELVPWIWPVLESLRRFPQPRPLVHSPEVGARAQWFAQARALPSSLQEQVVVAWCLAKMPRSVKAQPDPPSA